jgi:lipopolysaccharide export system protein LptA
MIVFTKNYFTPAATLQKRKLPGLAATFLLLSACLFSLLPLQVQAEEMLPINIEADRMKSDQQKNVVTFTGNVDARQGDLIIKAEQMTVSYGSGSGKSGNFAAGNVEKIHARGKVTISNKDWTAKADSLDFYTAEEKAHLIGNAEARQGQNTVSGESIILFLKEGRSVVEGGSNGEGRVKAVIYPKSVQE